jgi:lipoyl(octanoyl) transferase
VGLLARGLTTLDVQRLGSVGYADALGLQTDLHERRSRDEIADTLLLLEHPHVYTIGRRGSTDDVLLDEDALRARGVDVVEADRGGQVTYHGPGQLVGYPIVWLGPGADLVKYVRNLEEVMIRAMATFGIDAGRNEANSGIWVGNSKLGAIGVRVARGVTKHGFAVNVTTDLSYFAGIVPCGLFDKGVTSMATLGIDASMDDVTAAIESSFIDVFGYTS